VLSRPRVELVVVGRREAARPDHDGDAAVERREDVPLDGRRARVVGGDGVQRLRDGRVTRRIGAGDAGDELEIRRRVDCLGDRAPRPARDTRDADS
jgi:hypothetical protein